MRTTVTIDAKVDARLRRMARERGISFKDAFNSMLRAGLDTHEAAQPYRVPARPLMLRPGVDIDRALGLAATLEDETQLVAALPSIEGLTERIRERGPARPRRSSAEVIRRHRDG